MVTTFTEHRIKLMPDTDPTSPREWDNVGTMVCWHRRYNLGDEQPREDAGDYLQSLAIDACPRLGELLDYWENDGYDNLRELLGYETAQHEIDEHKRNLVAWVLDKFYVILPLYLYDHSGITMSTGRFSCPWDSGQVGFIYCTVERAMSECGSVEAATRCLTGEVETYDQYLTGDVYGFEIEGRNFDECLCTEDDDCPHWEHVDSCWGFYGSDPMTNGMAEHVPDDLRELLKSAEIEYP